MRRRSRGRRDTPTLVLAAAVCLLALAGAWDGGAGAFTVGNADRGTSVDVASDPNATLALDLAADVHVNATERLVTVTNNLGRDATVTVRLRDDTAHRGDLVLDGTNVGNSTSFALGVGANQRVDLAVPDDSSLANTTMYVAVSASASGLSTEAPDRAIPIEGETA
ncbi:MAG: hypothetical protein ABEJ42_04605 [Halobacteriaceae archaeon]